VIRGGETGGMRRLAVALGLVAVMGIAAGTALAKTVRVTGAANGATRTLTRSDRLLVSIPSNPTTGYQWKVASVTRSILRPTGSSFLASTKGRVGASGIQTLAFRAAAAGTTKLVIVYQQAGSKKIAGHFRLTVVVR
jgi:inhibitor of cysteine peptidase